MAKCAVFGTEEHVRDVWVVTHDKYGISLEVSTPLGTRGFNRLNNAIRKALRPYKPRKRARKATP